MWKRETDVEPCLGRGWKWDIQPWDVDGNGTFSLAWDIDGNGTFSLAWDVDGNGTFSLGTWMEMGHSALLGT